MKPARSLRKVGASQRTPHPLDAARPVVVLALLAAGCVTQVSRPVAVLAPPRMPPPTSPLSMLPSTQQVSLLHVSDTEAGVLGAGDIGGIARAQAVITALRANAVHPIVVHGGDSIIPSPELSLELDGKSVVVQANALLGAAAFGVGNHEFDMGEVFLADVIRASPAPYLSSDLFIIDGALKPLVVDVSGATPWVNDIGGELAARAKVCAGTYHSGACDGVTVGVVAMTTEQLRSVSKGATAAVKLPVDLAGVIDAVNAQVRALEAEGIHVIVALSHMQGVRYDLKLIERGLVGVDVIVSAGGEHLLSEPKHRLLPGDSTDPACQQEASCYPIVKRAADGAAVLIVSTPGDLRYVGALTVDLDADGHVTHIGTASRPVPLDETTMLELRASVDRKVLTFEQRARDALAPMLVEVGASLPYLEGAREHVRNAQTNLGDASADALLLASEGALSADARPTFALRNAGGIRASIGNIDVKGAKTGGPVRLLDVRTALKFDTKVVVVELSHQQLVDTLEAALIQAGNARGQFPQVSSGVRLVYAPAARELLPRVLDGKVIGIRCPGARVQQLVVPGARGDVVVVKDGAVVTPLSVVRIATLDYLTNGGDGWFPGAHLDAHDVVDPVTRQPVTEQSAFLALLGSGRWQLGAPYQELLPTTRISADGVAAPSLASCDER